MAQDSRPNHVVSIDCVREFSACFSKLPEVAWSFISKTVSRGHSQTFENKKARSEVIILAGLRVSEIGCRGWI